MHLSFALNGATQIQRWWPKLLFGSIAVLLLCFFLSLAFGAVSIEFQQMWKWLWGTADAQSALILQNIRLPRAILAMSVGAILAVCGAVTQGLFRNPLADPSLIGVSAGAAAGASFVIVLLANVQWSYLGLSLVSLGAFGGGLVAVIFVYRIATGVNGTSVATMLLAGIAITFLTGSLSNILEFFADNEMLRRISLWRMGGLDAADFSRSSIALVICVLLLVMLPRYAQALNALLLGESEARHLGVDVNRIKQQLVFFVALGVGVSVALAGTIAFIGLVVPHGVRMIIGADHKFLCPFAVSSGQYSCCSRI